MSACTKCGTLKLTEHHCPKCGSGRVRGVGGKGGWICRKCGASLAYWMPSCPCSPPAKPLTADTKEEA